MKRKVFFILFGFLFTLKICGQENALYTIRLNYEFKEWEDGCESCWTLYRSFPYVGLTSSNGGIINDAYTTNEVSLELTYYETRYYELDWQNNGPQPESYCNAVHYLTDEFTNDWMTDFCGARKNRDDRIIEYGEAIEYGNANSESLDTYSWSQAKSYAKSWLLANEPSTEPNESISRYYSELLFEREGVQVQDGYWEYLVQGNQDWKPINNPQVKSLFPLSITAEELDILLPENLKNSGNILLRFSIHAEGSGHYIKFFNAIPAESVHSEKRTIGYYSFEISPEPPGLDQQIIPNPAPSPVTCPGGLDGGFTITFDRVLTDEEKMVILVYRKTGVNTYEEDPWEPSGELFAEDFNDKTFLFEGEHLKAGIYGIKWMVGPKDEGELDVVGGDFVDITINEPPSLNVEEDGIDNVTCQGGNDGEITITPSGGSPPYTFTWKRNGNNFVLPQGSTNTHLVNLPEGTYTLTLTDSHDCDYESQEFEVGFENSSPQLDAHQVFQPGTPPNYLPTGSIIIDNIIGDSGNYILHWEKDGNPFQPQNPYHLDQLESGSYTLTIEDADYGCITVVEPPMTILELDPLSVEITETLEITCEGDVGILEANPSGGTNGGYQYLWSTGETTQSIQVGQGEYSVKVTDNGNSEVQEVYLFDYVNPLLSVEVSTIDVVCKDEATGSIELDISGGTGGPYTVSWLDTQQDGPIRTDLEAGQYIYIVSDGQCQVTNENQPIVIQEPEGFFTVEMISQTNVSLNGEEDGSFEISLDNGSPPYTFNWTKDGEPYEPKPESTNTNLVGLEAGIYQVVVIDALGCQATLETPIQITEPDPLAIIGTNTVHVNCKGDFTGSITANVTGIPPFTYKWKKQGDVSFTAPDQKTISGLSAGTYILSVSDNSIVPKITDVIEVSEPSEVLEAIAIPNITECFLGNEGNIHVSGSGGTPPYLYSINNGLDFQENPFFEALESGTYEVMVRDKNQCEYQTSVILGQPDQTNAEFAMSSQVVAGETVLAVDLSYPIPDELEWIVPDEAIVLSKNSDELELVFNQPGEYEVGIQAYRGDCLSTETKKILVLEGDGISEEVQDEVTLKKIESFIIFPNPTTGRFNVGIQLGQPGDVSLKIFGLANNSLIGQQQAFGKDEYEIPMDISGLPSGLYVVVLETQFGISIQKLILN
ncbi:T9SS type A sorting domain-containing protein [Muricauda sp. HICW]|uniref:T9SS type A sorting domain-containing protein n=1 Tax=Flagellimonas chongwuensis TaxID=2697365 RepID=A0A850NCM2_9FLAO|nr:T9SS type A sorting domain-containing protein [Allomuricauda chongwuensis]NVN18493.1 T9SS type A sorting domain-containing protein [Allomuricauda chongwuensis]